MPSGPDAFPNTPDGRYFVVRGRLWRCANPGLSEELRASLTRDLMTARRAKQAAMKINDVSARETARHRIDIVKHQLGERGDVWWTDGSPDLNRHMARNTVYADWYASIAPTDQFEPIKTKDGP